MPSPNTALDAIKSEVCDTTLVAMAWLVIPAVGVSIMRAQDIGWTAQYNGQIAAAVIVWLTAIFRARLPYALRASLIVVLLFSMGWTGQIVTTAPTSYVFYASASAMAAVFYGAWAGIVAIVLSVMLTAGTYVAIQAGLFPTPTYAAGMAVTTWISRCASLIVASAGPVIAVSEFYKSLTRELARAEAASNAKSSFLATMSHELRTPMTAIIGTAELLQGETLTDGQAKKVGRIARAGKNLLSLLNDLLDFAKIEAEQMPIDKVSFSLRDVLTEVRDLFSPLADEKGLALRLDNRAAVDALSGDPARLRQILNNLVGNAVKFTRSGEIVISAATEDLSPDGARGPRVLLRLDVRDTGIGIGASDQARLFEPFVQAQDFRSRSHGGTGLGLAISRRLAARMDGALEVASEEGRGSVFTLRVPLAVAGSAPAPAAAPSAEGGAPALSRRGLSVLLAEDNEAIRELMIEVVARRGHLVQAVENGRLAVDAVRARAFDAVIMDMHMPVMDGAEATRLIRAMPAAARLPIIALTAGLTEDQRKAYLAAGVDQIVAKPAHWPTLFEALEVRAASVEARSSLSDAPAFDAELFAELEAALGPEVVRGALVTFRSGMSGYVGDLAAALAGADLSAARKIGHAIKGASLQFGAAEVARLGGAIEAKSSTLEDMRRCADGIPAALARFEAALAARAA